MFKLLWILTNSEDCLIAFCKNGSKGDFFLFSPKKRCNFAASNTPKSLRVKGDGCFCGEYLQSSVNIVQTNVYYKKYY